MLDRNLMAMETEELLRSHPVDGTVLTGGCDKTAPGVDDGRDRDGGAVHLPARGADAARQLRGARAGLPTRSGSGPSGASGASFGACVPQVSPEAYVGGPLALLRTGDIVELDVPNRSLPMRVAEEELERRRAAWTPPPPRYERGCGYVYSRHIGPADRGCDLDFLRTEFGAAVPELEIR